jgi:hypothetical protein
MTPDVAVALPENDELSASAHETVDTLVTRLAETVGVESADLLSLPVERTDSAVCVRPDTPISTVEQGQRYEVMAVGDGDTGTRSRGSKHAPQSEE